MLGLPGLSILVVLVYHVQQAQSGRPADCGEHESYVDSVGPPYGSVEGGLRLTVKGQGFQAVPGIATDSAATRTGTGITLSCKYKSYPCDVDQQRVEPTKVECFVPPIPHSERPCLALVSINGTEVPLRCMHRSQLYSPDEDRTPTVSEVKPIFGPRNNMLTIKGRTFTGITASNQMSTITRAFTTIESGKTRATEREMISYDDETHMGYLKFRDNSPAYGCHRVDYYIQQDDAGYGGKSKTSASIMMWSDAEKAYSYQTYPVITNITPSPVVSSLAGGTRITLWGISKIDNLEDAVVKAGGAPCKVVQSTDEYLVCETPPQPDFGQCDFHPGNRGIIWKNYTGPDINQTRLMNESWSDFFGSVNRDNDSNDYSTEFSGCFKPPKDIYYQFKQPNDGETYFNPIPCNKTELLIMKTVHNQEKQYDAGYLDSEKCYYLRGQHKKHTRASNFHLGIYMPESNMNKEDADYPFVREEIQIVHAGGKRDPEIWEFSLPKNQMIKFTYQGEKNGSEVMKSEEHQFDNKTDTVAKREIRVRDLMLDLMSCHCISITNDTAYSTSYEYNPDASGNYDQRHVSYDALHFEDEPLCGRVSMKNPHWIYSHRHDPRHNTEETHIQIGPGNNQSKHLCVGGRGSFNKTYVVVRLYESNGTGATLDQWWDISEAINYLNFNDTWDFKCIDIYDAIIHDDWRKDHVNGSVIKLRDIVFEKQKDARIDYFIDYVHIGNYNLQTDSTNSTTNVMGTRNCVKPGGEMVQNISVVELRDNVTDTHRKYKLTLQVYKCGVNLALPGFDPNVTQVQRIQRTHRGVLGHFKLRLDYKNLTTQALPIDISEEDLRDRLQTDLELDCVRVYKRNWHCYRPHFYIHYCMPGNQQQLQVLNVSISCYDPNQEIQVYTSQQGGVKIEQIYETFMRTMHDEPQVTLEYHGNCKVAAKCGMSNRNCAISWEACVTPCISNVSLPQGKNGTEITITGTYLREKNDAGDKSKVTVDGMECQSVQVTCDTTMVCVMGPCGPGSHKVNVHIKGKGDACHPDAGNVMFSCTSAATTINPTSSGAQGGYPITIEGHGFTAETTVTIGGETCPLIHITYTRIEGTVPPGTVGKAAVVVTHPGGTVEAPDFEYLEETTATILSANPSSLTVEGTTVTLTAVNLTCPASLGDIVVTVGGEAATATSCNSTTDVLVIEAPPNTPGVKNISIKIGNIGYANSSLVTLTYILRVTSVCPERGSYAGSTNITITGAGFTDASKVTIGGVQCMVESLSYNQIICLTGPIFKTWSVVDHSKHPYYTWYPRNINIKEGDTVDWRWNMNLGLKMCPEETIDATSKEYRGSGFRSPVASRKGTYGRTFTSSGVRHYWTGFIDEEHQYYAHATVNVDNRTSETFKVDVSIKGYTALHNTQGAASCPTESIPSCADDSPAGNAGEVSFSYSSCSTPVVTGISPLTIRADGNITITMTDGTNENSEVRVTVCDKTCSVTASTTTSITCTMLHEDNLDCNKACPLTIIIGNFGCAYFEISDLYDKTLQMVAGIDNVSPNVGSIHGGTCLTIRGIGFKYLFSRIVLQKEDETKVICELLAYTYSEVQCRTRSGEGVFTLVNVTLNSLNGLYHIECSTDACKFEAHTDNTPVLSSGDFYNITDSPHTLSLIGQNLNGAEIEMWHSDNSTVEIPDCTNYHVCSTRIECIITGLQQHKDDYTFRITSFNGFSTNYTMNAQAQITSITPITSNTCGGLTLTINGTGFPTAVTVDFGSDQCSITSQGPSRIECTIPRRTSGGATESVNLRLSDISNKLLQVKDGFTYNDTKDFIVTSISTNSGVGGDQLTINGTSFGSTTSGVSVTINGVEQEVTDVTDTRITVTLVHYAACEYNVDVIKADKGCGDQDSQLKFTYELGVSSFSPQTGSFGGNQELIIEGTGFNPTDNTTTVKICGEEVSVTVTNYTRLKVITKPMNRANSTDQTCTVSVMAACGSSQNATTLFTYQDSQTPTITSVTPRRGGTGGNTRITIIGSNFGDVQGQGYVTIKESGLCGGNIFWNDTHISCHVPAPPRSMETIVIVTTDKGDSDVAQAGAADFWYIDVWSSSLTWGGGSIPGDGGFAQVNAGVCILIDQDTAILKMLHINGGRVLFDESVEHITLSAENIMITNNGSMTIGTEDKPYSPNRVTIKMYGQHNSTEHPIYGAKSLAIRHGTLSIHGSKIEPTWTTLSADADVGSTQLHLTQAVYGWKPGDTIIIATTGDYKSQNENQIATIVEITNRNKTLTIDPPIQAPKLGRTVQIGDISLGMHGEVGLLTRNIKFDGTGKTVAVTPVCDNNNLLGEYSTENCRADDAEEEPPTMFGGHIFGHSPNEDSHNVVMKIAYLELYHVGQAFRLGRHPIHFHLNGNMGGSYVKGCGFRNTFNRAINIHRSHHLLIESNVVYNSMGGTFFLEDGAEENNIFDRNLIVGQVASSSLANDDLTPAAFWITNPNNVYRNNHAAGGTHFGFWLRTHSKFDGASAHLSGNPLNLVFKEFINNTAHSQGSIGLWIFQDYYPVGISKFKYFTAWNCEKGAEWVDAWRIHFIGCVVFNNELAQFEAKFQPLQDNTKMFNDEGSVVEDTILVNYIDAEEVSRPRKTPRAAAILPQQSGVLFRGNTFVHCDNNSVAISNAHISGTCSDNCSGSIHKFVDTTWINCPKRIYSEWNSQSSIRVDASFTGDEAGYILPTVNGLNCDPYTYKHEDSVDLSFCRSTTPVMFAFNKVEPANYLFRDVCFTNTIGTFCAPMKEKRIKWKTGVVAFLMVGGSGTVTKYCMTFLDGSIPATFKYKGTFNLIPEGRCIDICFPLMSKPDRVQIQTGSTHGYNWVPQSAELNNTGDWLYNSDSQLEYRVCAEPGRAFTDVPLDLFAEKCTVKGCGEIVGTHNFPVYNGCFNETKTWEDSRVGENVIIAAGTCVHISESATYTAHLLVIHGTLEVHSGLNLDVILEVKYILIKQGYFVIGRHDQPFDGTCTIKMNGDTSDESFYDYSDMNIGLNTMVVEGGLELHGAPKLAWTKLSETVQNGVSQLVLRDAVDWVTGDEIFLTVTDFKDGHGERHFVENAADRMVNLQSKVEYEHLGSTHVLTDSHREVKTVHTQGEVCSFNRNVKITGNEGQGFTILVRVGYIETEEGLLGYEGYARISNVEFKNGGLEYLALFKPYSGCALMFLFLNDSAVQPQNWIRNSVFHDNRGAGICIIKSNHVEASDVVLHNSKPHGFYVDEDSENTTILHSLVTQTIWPDSVGNSEPNYKYSAAFHLEGAKNPVLKHNVGSGFQRTCMKLPHKDCTESNSPTWQNNECHDGLIGFERNQKHGGPAGHDVCMEIPNFIAWHCWDYGMFVEVKTAIKVKHFTGITNGISLFLMALEPAATNHDENMCSTKRKVITVKDSLLVGRTPDATCETKNIDTGKQYFDVTRGINKGPRRGFEKGFVGIVTQFSQGHNDAGGTHPRDGIMGYNTVCGLLEVKQTLFSHFNIRCGQCDAAIITNPANEDLTHPTQLKENTIGKEVDESCKIWIPPPSPDKVTNCGNMICDGKKKCLIKDMDGSFFQTEVPHTVISDSAQEWGQGTTLNVGNDRLPLPLVEPTGYKIDIDRNFPIKGFFRDAASCDFNPVWNAYYCHGYEYLLLVLESLDHDTEDRRLAPMAVVGYADNTRAGSVNKAVDLVNGPQDHGWCDGYPCNRRVSNFHIIVVSGYNFDVYFTGTPPQKMQLQMLNAKSNHKVRLAIYYKTSSRLDVYMVFDHNSLEPSYELKEKSQAPIDLSASCGANYQDKTTNLLYIIMCYVKMIKVRLSPVVETDMEVPYMTPEEYRASDPAGNMAKTFDTDQGNIHTTRIVSDLTGRRRKRQTPDTMKIIVIIASPPGASPEEADAAAALTQKVGSAIVSAIQLGTINKAANVTVLSATVRQPPPPPDSEAWADYAANENASEPVRIIQPKSTVSIQAPEPSHEGAPFTVYPAIRLLDAQGSPVELLGAMAVPWCMKAELILGSGSDSRAVLYDNVVPFYKGWANFTKLSISHSGTGYGLRFYVTYPNDASNITYLQVSVNDLSVAEATFKAQLRQLPAEIQPTNWFKVSVDVLDSVTNMLPKNISWKGHTFTATISIDPRAGYPGTLSPTSELQVELSQGTAMTRNLYLDSVGAAILSVSVVSSPAHFNLKATSRPIDVNRVLFYFRSTQRMSDVMLRFPGLSSLADNLLPFFLAAVQNKFSPVYKDITFNNFTRNENEVDFVVWGKETDIKKATDAIWDRIHGGFKISSGGNSYEADAYMVVDGTERVEDKETDSGNLAAIIAGSIVGAILMIGIVAVLVWFFLKGKPKSVVEHGDEPGAGSAEKGTVSNDGKPETNQQQTDDLTKSKPETNQKQTDDLTKVED